MNTCGCRVVDVHGDTGLLVYCPLHAAASELLEELEEWANNTNCPIHPGVLAPHNECECWACERVRSSRAAIKKAKT